MNNGTCYSYDFDDGFKCACTQNYYGADCSTGFFFELLITTKGLWGDGRNQLHVHVEEPSTAAAAAAVLTLRL